jgi:RHS repeat-associated protein
LSQVLSDGTDTYVYGHARLRALGGPWYVGDALGSVRQTLDDAGAVLGSVQYDPWGVPTAGTPQPFGFTGEVHNAGQVYLRARWYAPGNGTFTSRDPFAGWAERPYSLHPYQYGYSNPLRWTDASGKQPSLLRGWELVGSVREVIKETASLAAGIAPGFDTETVAATMGAILYIENQRSNPLSHRAKGDLYRSFPFTIHPRITSAAGLPEHTEADINNSSTGLPNIRPTTVIDIFNGVIRKPDGTPFTVGECFVFNSLDDLPPLIKESFYRARRDGLDIDNIWDRRAIGGILQDQHVALELLAANIRQGIIRATLLEEVEKPTIFNLGTWHSRGVQTIDHIRAQRAQWYGLAMLAHLDRSAQVLGVEPPPTAVRVSPSEHDAFVGNPQ